MSTYTARKNQAISQGLTYRKLLSTSALVAAGLVSLHTAPALADNSWGNLNQDAGSFTTDIADPNVTNIKLNTNRAIGSGNADIYLGDTVNVDGALFVVRDTRADPTRILGNLNSNGEIIIIDDNGVFFGKNSVVDVAGLIATTGSIGNADIMDGDGHFDITNLGNGAIDLQGTINIADAGLAAFVAPTVTNSGVINARLGTVAFAAGQTVTVDMYGDGLFEVAVNGALGDALLQNAADGEINAEGGTVTMTASAAKDVVNDIINVDGVVKVSSATVKGGKIILSGGDNGTVKLSGKLDASGTTGGDINVTGQTVEITETAEIINNGDQSNSYVFGSDKAIFRGSLQAGTNAQAEISGKELVLGGTIDLDDGSTISFDPIIFTVGAGEAATFVSALNNNNVTVDVEAEQLIILNADIDTTAQTTNSVLNFKDENADNSLQVNLNAEIRLGASQDLTGEATLVNVVNTALIQNGVDIAASGATVNVGAGIYNEQVNVDKALNLIGTSTSALTVLQGTGTGTGIDVDADNVTLNGLTVDNFLYGVEVDSDVANLTLNDIVARNNSVGLKVSGAATLNGLDVDDSHFDDNTFGWYFTKDDNNIANTSTVTNVTVDDTSFSGNLRKGIYVEKLDNAAFTNVVVDGSGVDAAYRFNAGLDINLKNGTYTNISFDNLTVVNSGVDGAGFGSAVAVKARNDGSTYSVTPATLTNFTITNSDITAAGGAAIAIGYGVDGANITNNINITGPEAVAFYGGVQNANVSGNTINSTGLSVRGGAYGVGFFGTQTAKATGNTVTGTGNQGSGVWASASSDVTIGGAALADGNTVSDFKNGIHVENSTGTTLIQNNTANANTDTNGGRASSDWTTGIGILVNNTTGAVSIADNTANNNVDGIRVRDTDGAIVSGNTADGNTDKGIISKYSDDIQITENTVTNSSIGVYLDGSANGLVQANTIDGATVSGIHLRSNGTTTTADIKNNFIWNAAVGVGVESANTSASIYDNSFAAADGTSANGVNINNGSNNIVDASFNWFGSNDDVTVAASVTGDVDISPMQAAGVDTSTDAGYQGGADNLIVTTLGAQTSGLIQEAVDLVDDNGTVTVNAGDYTENLFLDVLGLKLVGLTGANLSYDSTNAGRGVAGNLITVTAANTTIDPFTFDGAGVADYGVNAAGAGAEGLTVDGNTFKNFKKAGVKVAANSATTGTIVGNTFEGSSTNGIETGDLDGGYTLDILNNTIGTNADTVKSAVKFGRLRNATINVNGGTMDTSGDAIKGGNVGSNVAINLNNLDVEAGDEAVDFEGNLDGDVTISGGTLIGAGSGIETNFIGGNGNLVIKDGAVVEGQHTTQGHGINIQRNRIDGALSVTDSSVKGGVSGISGGGLVAVNGSLDVTNSKVEGVNGDGIKVGDVNGSVNVSGGANITGAQNGILVAGDVNGGLVQVTDSTLNGTAGDGIEIGDVVNGGVANIVYNNISAGEDGIQINGNVTGGSRVQLAGNVIGYGTRGAVGDDGIEFTGDVENSTVILSHYGDALRRVRAQSIRANGDGIVFGGDINSSNVEIATYIATAGVDGLRVAGNIDNSTLTTGAATFDALTGGTGAFGGFQANAGQDGIEFEGQVRNGSTIDIDSNFGIRGQNGDGIRFERDIATGSTVNISTNRNDFGGDAIVGSNNGISIEDVKTSATVNIDNNRGITGQNGNGIEVESITGAGTVNVTRNTINGDDDGIFVSEDISGTGSSLNVRGNTIVAGDDGLDIDSVANGATVNIGGFGRFDGNNIVAGSGSSDDGIEFDAGVDANVNIVRNRISAGGDGIFVTDQDFRATTGVDNGAIINITNNNIGSLGRDSIGKDGINFDDSITGGSIVNISGNSIGRSGAYVGDDGIDIDSIEGGATVNITNNPNNYASDNGIEVSGQINNATLNITGNNHGIHAGDHGIYVGGNVWFGSTVNIHDNIISASENRNGVGDGIRFDGDIYTATVNIGDGNGNGVFNDPSNFIRGEDGIHFDGFVTNGADINIDGNRIGYGKTSGGRVFADRVGDDGIQFIGDIAGQASVSITDNYILAGDDGVSFIGEVEDDARVLIGGAFDGNTIDANGAGIQFQDDIKERALLTISYNEIEADGNGIEFNGNTSNSISSSANPSEILIANNDVDGGQNGILFEGLASNGRHDIVIRDNTQILGRNGDGVRHVGGINGAEVAITNNDRIAGLLDGVHVEGFLYNNARLDITGNDNVTARFGDGIEVTDTGFTNGANVNINGNDVTRAGDNGIEVTNVDDVEIRDNTVTNVGTDGVNVDNSDRAQITGNTIFGQATASVFGAFSSIQGAGRDGIHVEDSHSVVIDDNTVQGDSRAFRKDALGAGRHGIYVSGGNTLFSGNGVQITNNKILGEAGGFIFPHSTDSVGEDGIRVENNNAGLFGTAPVIAGNEVERTGENGIYVDGSAFMLVDNNDVTRAGDDGIQVINSVAADITNNRINFTGDDGIDVENSAFADINDNIVSNTGDDGIDVEDSFDADVQRNIITVVSSDGIELTNSFGADIRENVVLFAGDDGIDVEDSNFVDIADNIVGLVAANGIEVQSSDNADIERNAVGGTGQNGIYVNPSDDVTIDSNLVLGTLGDGIQVNGGENADVTNNLVFLTGDNGINVNNNTGDVNITDNTIALTLGDGIEATDNANGMIIADNTITFTGDDGIDVEGSRNARIDDNTISNTAANGIFIENSRRARANDNTIENAAANGIYFDGVNRGRANRNTITDSGNNGIFIQNSSNDVRVHDNVITGSLVSGIEVDNVDAIGILNNDITDSGSFGLLASGGLNGAMTLSGNTFTNNPTGARFESGIIDISDLLNPNTFTNTDPDATPVGLQFDEVGAPGSLSLAGNTIGGTVFDGFTNPGSFYVRIEDGALLDTVTAAPIIINGLDASFDGFVPNSVGGVLTQAQLDTLEDRIFDADDIALDGRGQLFVGFVPELGLDNLQDFFNQFGGFPPGFSGLNVLIRNAAAPAPASALNFANIEPAAGEGEDESGEGVADIEPAAGEETEDAACWGDAVSADGSVSYNFGGSFEESLADAASCGS
jgi:parallel beta-helix repeat protein